MFNVWALERNSGEYRSFVVLPIDAEEPDTMVEGHEWVKIGRNVSEAEAEAIMNQYPHVARARC